MNSLKTFELFSSKIEDYYNQLIRSLDAHVKDIFFSEISEEALQEQQLIIFNDIFKFPKFEYHSIEKAHNILSLSMREADSLIGQGFSFSFSVNEYRIDEIEYKIRYFGGLNSVQFTEKYPKRSFRGTISNDYITLKYHFQNSNLDEIGPRAKEDKDNLIQILEDNAGDISAFFESKKQAFLNIIKLKIEDKVFANKKKKDDLDKF